MSCRGQPWSVLGGRKEGGIVVRAGKPVSSPKLPVRLAYGALVKELERDDNRLLYELLSGTGPHEGWVSITAKGQKLLEPVGASQLPSDSEARAHRAHLANHSDVFSDALLTAGSQTAEAAEAPAWDERQYRLYHQTDGLYSPGKSVGEHRASTPCGSGRSTCVSGRVSVVTPTTEARREFHESLWRCFSTQRWADKELVVVETYTDAPSDFFFDLARSEPCVRYVRFRPNLGADWSIGLKRNIGADLATGEFIAQFDDDDLYAPTYLETLVGALSSKKEAKGIKLSSWYIFDTLTGTFGFCDPVRWGYLQQTDVSTKVRKWVYGYGFSYLYRRKAVLDCPFEDKNLGEDYSFFSRLQERHGEECIMLLGDEDGICLHRQHGSNTSSTVALWEVRREEIADLEVAEVPHFTMYMFMFPRKNGERSEFIEDWTGDGNHVRLRARRRYRDVTVHTSFGSHVLRCTKGAIVKELLVLVEAKLGALSPEARIFTKPLSESPSWPLEENSRIGAWTAELWLLLPEDSCSGATSSSAGSAAAPRPRSRPHVHVVCPADLAPGSASRVFNVSLPLEATVGDLRRSLGSGLPPDGQMFSGAEGKGRVLLREVDPVPETVLLSKYEGQVTLKMVLTRDMAHEVQLLLKERMKQPVVQKKLDELERKAAGNDMKYRMYLKNFLNWEVYPPILNHFGLPKDDRGPLLLWQATGAHLLGDLELNEAWLELEVLMRNRLMAHQAWQAVQAIKSEQHAGSP